MRELTDPDGRRRGPQATHGTLTRWLEGCDCDRCREAQNDAARARFRRKAQQRLPAKVRQQLVDAIYGGQPFRTALRDLGLTSNRVWGLTKSDEEWSVALDTAPEDADRWRTLFQSWIPDWTHSLERALARHAA